MDKEIEKLRNQIIRGFPNLASDDLFEITSPQTPNYNCLAWACKYKDRWMQPPSIGTSPALDGVSYWPKDAIEGLEIDCLVDAFQKEGFEICDNWQHEENFQKAALYVIDGNWTHASRELRKGVWTSKLGCSNDIQHGTPYSVEGINYGQVYCIMKKPFK